MRKISRTSLMLAMALLVLVSGGIFAQNGNQVSGTINDLSGTVELKYSGSADFVAAKAGDTVQADTVISTGFKSTALVTVGSALITVRPLTRLTLTEIETAAGSETINVNLQTGRVKVDLTPPAGTKASMTVSSPSATASVRGTSFDFDTRNLSVHEGTVGFAGNRGQVMLVGAGSDSRVESNGRAADPVAIKTAGLRPPSPAGENSNTGKASGNSARTSGTFTIGIEYPDSQ